MNGKFWVEERDMNALDMTLSITMNVEEWRVVREALQASNNYDATRFARFIVNAVNEVQRGTNQFVGEPKESENQI